MFSLLNKLSWLVSLMFGLSISSFVGFTLMGATGSGGYYIMGLIIGIIIKYTMFAPEDIERAIAYLGENGDNTNTIAAEKTSEGNKIVENKLQLEVEESDIILAAEKETLNEKEEVKSRNHALKNEAVSGELKIESNWFSDFFAENLLAKVGGIIVFIGVLFFLSVVYSMIGPVGKLLIGFGIGFAFYTTGVYLDKKGLIGESRVVMGLGILINYLVILSGKHILGEGDASLLSSGLTFSFLILNTCFAVVTSLVFRSQSLLIFSFLFAYLNPLLLGETSSDPYTLLIYTMLVSFGSIYLAYKEKNFHLFALSYIFANILIFAAPAQDASAWVIKLICINLLGSISLYVSTLFKQQFKYLSEALIAVSYALISLLGIIEIGNLSTMQFMILGVSALGLMSYTYFFAKKGAYLYSLGTIGTILTLSPVIFTQGLSGELITSSVLFIIIFGVLNIGYILLQQSDFISKNLGNILSGSLAGAAFLGYVIFMYGQEYFPGMTLGLSYVGFAIIYAIAGFLFVQKNIDSNTTVSSELKTVFETLSAIAVSLFSLAVIFIFASRPEIISIIWLLEAAILYHFAAKKSSGKILIGASILFVISFIRFTPFIEVDVHKNYTFIASLLIIFGVLIKNIFSVNSLKDMFPEGRYFHHIVYACFTGLIAIMTLIVFDFFDSEWYTLIFINSYIIVLGIFYRYILDIFLKLISSLVLVGFFGLHLFGLLLALEGGFFGAFKMNLLVSIILLTLPAAIFVYEYIKEKKIVSNILFILYILYVFLATSIHTLYIFDVTYALTFYWGILSFILLGIGISKELPYLRTVGLYLLLLTVLKIFFYDIWESSTSDGIGFLAFIITGILMIVLSSMYSKHLGKDALKNDFSLSNIFPKK